MQDLIDFQAHPASHRRSIAGAWLLAIALATAACGGSPPAPTVPGVAGGASASPAGTASLDPRDTEIAWARCMRGHGVDIPDPGAQVGSGTAQIDKGSATFEAAVTACASLRSPSGPAANETPDPAYLDQVLAYAKCMRQHGINMPDPIVGSGQSGSGAIVDDRGTGSGPGLFDPGSTAFQDADRACGVKGGKGSTPADGGPAVTSGTQP